MSDSVSEEEDEEEEEVDYDNESLGTLSDENLEYYSMGFADWIYNRESEWSERIYYDRGHGGHSGNSGYSGYSGYSGSDVEQRWSSSEFDESELSQESYDDQSTRTDSGYGPRNGGTTHYEDDQDSGRPTVPEHYCRRCNRSFAQADHLHQHWRDSNVHPYYCATCKVDFERQADLEV